MEHNHIREKLKRYMDVSIIFIETKDGREFKDRFINTAVRKDFGEALNTHLAVNRDIEVETAIKLSGQKLIRNEAVYAVRVDYDIADDDVTFYPREYRLYFIGENGNQLLAQGNYQHEIEDALTERADRIPNHVGKTLGGDIPNMVPMFGGLYWLKNQNGFKKAIRHLMDVAEGDLNNYKDRLSGHPTRYPCLCILSYNHSRDWIYVTCNTKYTIDIPPPPAPPKEPTFQTSKENYRG